MSVVEALIPVPNMPPAAPGDYVEQLGNLVHRRSRHIGNVSLKQSCVVGRGAIIRGDIAKVAFGSFVFIGEGAVVRPPLMLRDSSMEAYASTVGDFVYIGAGTVVEASVIGSGVILGDGAVIGSRVSISNSVIVLPGSVVPAVAVLGPFGVYQGNPAQRVAELPCECAFVDIREWVVRVVGFASVVA